MAAKPIPEGVSVVTPYLCVANASKALEFYHHVFGAKETMRFTEPGSGRIGHAELKLGGGTVMLSDEYPEMGYFGPKATERPPVSIHVYVDDVDAVYQRALSAGATSQREPQDQFYGDRSAEIRDPFGHSWFLATRIEEVSAEDMQKRFDSVAKQQH
jgi:PhnB protein